VQYIKSFGISGNAAKVVSFIVGLLVGGLFYWVFVDFNPELILSVKILIGVMFLLVAGLTASGFYDLKKAG